MSGIGLLALALISGALAAVLSAVSWRVARDERQRRDARIAALAADIHGDAPHDLLLHQGVAGDGTGFGPAPPFGPPVEAPATSTSRAVAAAGFFVLASVTAMTIWARPGPAIAPRGPLPIGATTIPVAPTPRPLELVALGHERDGDRLTVRGIVRNPSPGADVERLAAVISVFDRNGAFLVSARGSIAAPAMHAGTESSFAVTIPNLANVGRYRVSFEDADRVVSHVDKRSTRTLARAQ
jgi:hypothetical protein